MAGRTTRQLVEASLVLQLFTGKGSMAGFAVVHGQSDSSRLLVCCCECEYSVILASALLLLPCAFPSAQALLFPLLCSLPKQELPLLRGCSLLGTVAPSVQRRLSAPAIMILTDYYCYHCWGKRSCNLWVLTGLNGPACCVPSLRET